MEFSGIVSLICQYGTHIMGLKIFRLAQEIVFWEFLPNKGKIQFWNIFQIYYRTCYTLVIADPYENFEYKDLMSSQLNCLAPRSVK